MRWVGGDPLRRVERGVLGYRVAKMHIFRKRATNYRALLRKMPLFGVMRGLRLANGITSQGRREGSSKTHMGRGQPPPCPVT